MNILSNEILTLILEYVFSFSPGNVYRVRIISSLFYNLSMRIIRSDDYYKIKRLIEKRYDYLSMDWSNRIIRSKYRKKVLHLKEKEERLYQIYDSNCVRYNYKHMSKKEKKDYPYIRKGKINCETAKRREICIDMIIKKSLLSVNHRDNFREIMITTLRVDDWEREELQPPEGIDEFSFLDLMNVHYLLTHGIKRMIMRSILLIQEKGNDSGYKYFINAGLLVVMKYIFPLSHEEREIFDTKLIYSHETYRNSASLGFNIIIFDVLLDSDLERFGYEYEPMFGEIIERYKDALNEDDLKRLIVRDFHGVDMINLLFTYHHLVRSKESLLSKYLLKREIIQQVYFDDIKEVIKEVNKSRRSKSNKYESLEEYINRISRLTNLLAILEAQ